MQGFKLTDQEQTLVHAAARELAAAYTVHHGSYDEMGVAMEAVRLVVAVRDEIRDHNRTAAEAEANLAQRGVTLEGVAP